MTELYDPDTPLMMLLFNSLIYDVLDRLFPEHRIYCNSKEEFQIFDDILNEVSVAESNKTNYHCCICLETKKGKEMIKLPCENAHYICSHCTKDYYNNLINEGRISYIRCPECDYHEIDLNAYDDYRIMKDALFKPNIPFNFFKDILSDDTCKKYEELFYSKAVIKLSKHSPYACVACRKCDTWCVKSNLDE